MPNETREYNLLKRVKLDIGLPQADETHDEYLLNKFEDALMDIRRYIDPSKLDISHIPTELIDVVLIKLVVLYFNRRGLEGTGYFSEGGLSFSYKEKNEALSDLSRFQKPTLTNIRGEVIEDEG